MFDRAELELAVDLHARAFNLLRWVSTAISKGIIQLDGAHDYLDESEAAREWIERHFLNLPPSCRPEFDQLETFSKYFATYLTTSFELVKQPGVQVQSSCGCFCPICTHLAAAPHLKTKKLSRRDKQRTRKLKLDVLQRLAHESHTRLEQQRALALIGSAKSAMDVSLITYGHHLVERTRGISDGPAVLALWREIAWEEKGSPKKDFQLNSEDILRAKESIANMILESAADRGNP